MIYIMFFCVEFGVVHMNVMSIFTSVQGKDNALLLGGCGSFSGRESGETRLCLCWFE